MTDLAAYKLAARSPKWVPKLVATDLDGTYICLEHGLSDANRAARVFLETQGIPVVPVTGRGPRLLDLTRREIGEGGLLIMGQGGVVYDGRTLLHREFMSRDHAEHILRLIHSRIGTVRLGAEDGADFEAPLRLEHGFTWPYGMDESVHVESDDILGSEVLKFFVQSDEVPVDELAARIREFIGPDDAYVTHSGIGFVEISPPNVSKAAGVQYICDRFGIEHDAVLAFGDMPNDLPMFASSGRAVAMGDAHPLVAEAADDTASDACDLGFARYIAGLFPEFADQLPALAARPETEEAGHCRPPR
ncbi:HAD-IIB family hydrolase [Epidermidibacterium keratini]|uniref:HAD-IIB family hydrolase n=1 Tax=Epidermidibacterium keratini TaxID=1891644 RepID=A0A7L4YN98_9ACTN|nr:HAD family hydrolase [Epidermidibacterium keratini]QHC00761.1 HAD-IIB family hydrolase [Epidermidibacterium keratini]